MKILHFLKVSYIRFLYSVACRFAGCIKLGGVWGLIVQNVAKNYEKRDTLGYTYPGRRKMLKQGMESD
jgi:hypothetical protein